MNEYEIDTPAEASWLLSGSGGWVALREATFYGTDDIWLTTQDWYLEGASVVADITGMTEK